MADEVFEVLLFFHQVVDQSFGLFPSADLLRQRGFAQVEVHQDHPLAGYAQRKGEVDGNEALSFTRHGRGDHDHLAPLGHGEVQVGADHAECLRHDVAAVRGDDPVVGHAGGFGGNGADDGYMDVVFDLAHAADLHPELFEQVDDQCGSDEAEDEEQHHDHGAVRRYMIRVDERLVDHMRHRPGSHHGERRFLPLVQQVGVEGGLDLLVTLDGDGFPFQVRDVAHLLRHFVQLFEKRLFLYPERTRNVFHGPAERVLHGDDLGGYLAHDGVVFGGFRAESHPFQHQFVVFVDGVRQRRILYPDVHRQDAELMLLVEDVADGGEHLQLDLRREEVVPVFGRGFQRQPGFGDDVHRRIVALELLDRRIHVGEFALHRTQSFVDETHGRLGGPTLAVDGVVVVDLDELVGEGGRLDGVVVDDGDVDDVGISFGLRHAQ